MRSLRKSPQWDDLQRRFAEEAKDLMLTPIRFVADS